MKLNHLKEALDKFNELPVEIKQNHQEIHVEVEVEPWWKYSLGEFPDRVWIKFKKGLDGCWYYKGDKL